MKSLKKAILYLIILLTLNSCSSKGKLSEKNENTINETDSINKDFNLDTLKGIYYGDFGGKDIRIVLNFINNKHALGYNIVNGLQRNVSGNVLETEKTIEISLVEPCDNEFDGVFKVNIDKASFQMSGEWKSLNGKISKKHINLTKLITPDRENEKIDTTLSVSSFAYFINMVSDSLGKMYFQEDGLCIYKYYPNLDDSERKEQYISIKGSWAFKSNKIIISWQSNDVFPNKKSIFNIKRECVEGNDFNSELIGENRTFTQNIGY